MSLSFPPFLQITLLASGRLMYTGPTDGLTRWFTSLGYHYDPSDHGMASDWALDLVSLGFAKPQQGARPAQQQVRHICCRILHDCTST
jgi:hypothetical protein